MSQFCLLSQHRVVTCATNNLVINNISQLLAAKSGKCSQLHVILSSPLQNNRSNQREDCRPMQSQPGGKLLLFVSNSSVQERKKVELEKFQILFRICASGCAAVSSAVLEAQQVVYSHHRHMALGPRSIFQAQSRGIKHTPSNEISSHHCVHLQIPKFPSTQ